jgi:hypothetical protein
VRDRSFETVVAALVRLGCQIARDGEWYVSVCFGAVLIQHVPKTMVPVAIQRRIIEAFQFSEDVYLEAIEAGN